MKKNFANELAELINRHGIDNDLNTPDWVLANLLVSTLNTQKELQVAAADGVRNDDPDDDCDCPICQMRRAFEAKGAGRPEPGKKEYRKPQVSNVPKEVADIIEIVKQAMPDAKIEVAGFGVVRDNRNNPRNRRRKKNKRNGGRNNG